MGASFCRREGLPPFRPSGTFPRGRGKGALVRCACSGRAVGAAPWARVFAVAKGCPLPPFGHLPPRAGEGGFRRACVLRRTVGAPRGRELVAGLKSCPFRPSGTFPRGRGKGALVRCACSGRAVGAAPWARVFAVAKGCPLPPPDWSVRGQALRAPSPAGGGRRLSSGEFSAGTAATIGRGGQACLLAIQRSILVSSTSSGTEPSFSTSAWNSRMSNFPPRAFSERARSSLILSSPIL